MTGNISLMSNSCGNCRKGAVKVVVTGDFSIFELIQGLFLVDYPTLHGKTGFSDGYSNDCQIPEFFSVLLGRTV